MESLAEVGIKLDRAINRGREVYKLGNTNVSLNWLETSPQLRQGEILDKSKAAIFLPGWAWDPETPIITGIANNLADGTLQNTYAVSTRVDRFNRDALLTEARGVAEYVKGLKEAGVKEVTIIGHSEGGIKAMNLAALLEQIAPEIKLNGLVLIGSVGLSKRNFLELGYRFFIQAPKIIEQEAEKVGVPLPEGGAKQFWTGLWRDMQNFNLKYPVEVIRESIAMASLNPRLKQVKSPVLVLASERDFVSDYRRYIPQEEVDQRLLERMSDDQLKAWVIEKQKWEHLPPEEQAKFNSKEEFIKSYMDLYRKQEERVRLRKAQQQALKEKTLPESENVKFVVATKAGSHTGPLDARGDQVSRVISQIFPHLRRAA